MSHVASTQQHNSDRTVRRSNNLALGTFGEQLAAVYLQEHGYTVLDRNWRAGRTGELDLVVRNQTHIVAVEVKTRSGHGYGSPFEVITARKIARLRSLLFAWVQAHRPIAGSLRIDAIAVTAIPGEPPQIEHVRGIA